MGEKLNRQCVVCGQDNWQVMNESKRVTAIKCTNCNHVELEIFPMPYKILRNKEHGKS